MQDKIKKGVPKMGFNNKKLVVLSKMKHLKILIKWVSINELVRKPGFKTIYRIKKY